LLSVYPNALISFFHLQLPNQPSKKNPQLSSYIDHRNGLAPVESSYPNLPSKPFLPLKESFSYDLFFSFLEGMQHN